jgi:hypothetical protein
MPEAGGVRDRLVLELRGRPGYLGWCLIRRLCGGRLAGMPLSERERAVLDLERSWWQEAETKEVLIRSRLGISATAYYKLLRRLVDSPAAREHDPLLVLRLKRARDERRRARYEGRSSAERPGR